MKVLMISRATLFSSPGGDTVQIESTAKYLRLLGVEVDICLANEKPDYADYDLLHFFNIIRPADILPHISASNNKPFVVSTIFVDYGECERRLRKGFYGLLTKVLPGDTIEYLKAIARMLRNGERVRSWYYLLHGHRKSIQHIIQQAKLLLPNSESEYQRLKAKYGIDQRYVVVPNAIDKEQFQFEMEYDDMRDAVLCVGRIELRKNQLNLIKALKGSAYPLYIIGKPSSNNLGYYAECKAAADENVHFIPHVFQAELPVWYRRGKVHALPSWFETTGLSSLEAGVMGCNLVICAKGDTREYFQDDAFYCEPDDLASIRLAVEKAYLQPTNENLRKRILKNYTWEKAASATLQGYRRMLG